MGNNFPKKRIVESLRKMYPVGCRVALVRMDDSQAPPVGTEGTVTGVDDIGSIMVKWDNGSRLNVVYGEDECQRLISREMLREALQEGYIWIENSRYEDGLYCSVYGECSSVILSVSLRDEKAGQMSAREYIESVPRKDIVESIYNSLKSADYCSWAVYFLFHADFTSLRHEIRGLNEGDIFFVHGVEHTASCDAHPSGDASCTGYIVYDELGQSYFECDFPEYYGETRKK